MDSWVKASHLFFLLQIEHDQCAANVLGALVRGGGEAFVPAAVSIMRCVRRLPSLPRHVRAGAERAPLPPAAAGKPRIKWKRTDKMSAEKCGWGSREFSKWINALLWYRLHYFAGTSLYTSGLWFNLLSAEVGSNPGHFYHIKWWEFPHQPLDLSHQPLTQFSCPTGVFPFSERMVDLHRVNNTEWTDTMTNSHFAL